MEMEMETDPISPSPDDTTASGGEAKACADCHTTKTPLWRGGPEGPKSLCNACGIRYRKRRRQALGLDANADPQEQQQHKKKANKNNSKEDKKKDDEQVTVELRVVGFGKEVVLKQRRQMRRKKCLSEEERAAILLMALSSGVIYAS
ncbi:GATA transcription factor 16-like [Phragmites australis]|uniref:GATA transcription factor 16-like n=1 Tax=Phragmites australis TaxID=29695 RepID=UPI002D7725E7|nr:GATA transcription factor 16-like [Phragmites australis]